MLSHCRTVFQITLALYWNVSDGSGVSKKVSLLDRLEVLNSPCIVIADWGTILEDFKCFDGAVVEVKVGEEKYFVF